MSFALNRACATGDCSHLRCTTRPHTRYIINQFFKNDKTPKWVKVSKMEAYAQAKGWRLVTAEKIVDEITGINYRGVGSGRTYVWKQDIILPVWVALNPFPSPETEKEKVFKQRLVIIPMGDDQDAEGDDAVKILSGEGAPEDLGKKFIMDLSEFDLSDFAEIDDLSETKDDEPPVSHKHVSHKHVSNKDLFNE